MNRKSLIVVILLAFAIGTMVNLDTPGQKKDRPFLKLLALAARLGLTLMVFEPPPQDCKVHHELDYVDHARSL